jgi:hypothetical protein
MVYKTLAALVVVLAASQAQAAIDLGTLDYGKPIAFPITFFDKTFDSDRDRGGYELGIAPNPFSVQWLLIGIEPQEGNRNLKSIAVTINGREPEPGDPCPNLCGTGIIPPSSVKTFRFIATALTKFAFPADGNALKITATSKEYGATWFKVDMHLVPIPGALPLGLSALAALGGLAWTRRQNPCEDDGSFKRKGS